MDTRDFPTFNELDFDVFSIPGLEPRMQQLIQHVRPKLTQIGEQMAPFLSAHCGEPMYPHVAKHARRTINPPADTWVAWANNRKGYKAHPHFQVGLWSTHMFVQFAVIYESANKSVLASNLSANIGDIRRTIPADYRWSTDHMLPDTTLHRNIGVEDFERMIERLKNVKKAEALCGIRIERGDPILKDSAALRKVIEETFQTVMPLYRMSFT